MNGTTDVVDLSSINSDFASGDTLIIRKSTSDGAKILNPSEYDVALTGGTLQTYESASGLKPDDIIVDGDELVSPTTCPAPEEVVPGHVVDTVAIKVFDYAWNGSAKMAVERFIGTGLLTEYPLSYQPNSSFALIVKMNGTLLSNGIHYYVDYTNNKLIFTTPPVMGADIVVFNIGFSGLAVIKMDSFVSKGTETLYDTFTPWIEPLSMLVYVDGMVWDATVKQTPGDTIGIQFGTAPMPDQLVTYIITNSSEHEVACTKLERFAADGRPSTDYYPLQYIVGDGHPAEAKMIVRVDQKILTGPDVVYFTVKGNKYTYALDPTRFPPYSVNVSDVTVCIGEVVLAAGSDYVVELNGVNVKLSKGIASQYAGRELLVVISTNSEYSYRLLKGGPTIQFPVVYNRAVIEVLSSYNHVAFDMHRTEIRMSTPMTRTGDTPVYYTYQNMLSGVIRLDRAILNEDYVWIIKNGVLLIPSKDFILNSDRMTVQLVNSIARSDKVTIITFGNNLLSSNLAYMQFKDMLNRTHYKRLNHEKQTTLAKALRINDLTIEVTDASHFDIPNPSLNMPGVLDICGERIEYFIINGNVLGQLRRGTLGTGARSIYPAGATVQEIGPSETLPYSDDISILQVPFTGDNLIRLDYIPQKADTSWSYRGDIPAEYGQCDEIEVFVGGYDIFGEWAANTMYEVGMIVRVGMYLYRNAIRHRSMNTFFDNVTTYNEDGTESNTNVPYTTVWKYFIGNVRLNKRPFVVHNINISSTNAGNVSFPADFAVDGVTNAVRLTHPLKVGTYVTIIRRKGSAWDTMGDIRADHSPVAAFLQNAPGALYSTL
jgi:hypothetical protein